MLRYESDTKRNGNNTLKSLDLCCRASLRPCVYGDRCLKGVCSFHINDVNDDLQIMD